MTEAMNPEPTPTEPVTDGQQDGIPDVDVEQHVAAEPDEVFAYIADPERFPGVAGGPVTIGDAIAVEPPHRVAWRVDVTDGERTLPGEVEVTLTPDRDGTRVRVVQRTSAPRAVCTGGALALAA